MTVFKTDFELRQAFARCFQSLQGKGVLDYIINISAINRCVQAPPNIDALHLAWWEGRRALAQDIINLTKNVTNQSGEQNYA